MFYTQGANIIGFPIPLLFNFMIFQRKRMKTTNHTVTSVTCFQLGACHIQQGPKQNHAGTRPVQ